jgi:hypothetical protein
VIAQSPAYHDHPRRRLLLNFPDTTWDTELKGFGLRTKPSGVKSYVLKYRVGSRTKRLTIGKHGPLWTAEDARRQALDLLRSVRDGRDPAAEKSEAREALTVATSPQTAAA